MMNHYEFERMDLSELKDYLVGSELSNAELISVVIALCTKISQLEMMVIKCTNPTA